MDERIAELEAQVARLRDYKALAHDALNVVYCKGGRPINSGWRCTHCESFDPGKRCKKPLKEKQP